MPSDAWKLARAASRAAVSSRAAAAAASRDSPVATAAAPRGSAVAAAHSRGGVNHPPSRYHLVRDPSSTARLSTGPSKFNDEEAYLPIQEAYRFFSSQRRRPDSDFPENLIDESQDFEEILEEYEEEIVGNPEDYTADPPEKVGPLFNLDIRSDKEGMPFDVKDLESEQTLWALYNRWCSYFNVARSSVEKDYRFNIFKEKVRLIYELKGADPKNLELNHLCDVSIDELCPPKFSYFLPRY